MHLRSSCDHDEVVRVRVQQYNNTLQSQRRQAGLITIPSSNLIEAERKLAEVRTRIQKIVLKAGHLSVP